MVLKMLSPMGRSVAVWKLLSRQGWLTTVPASASVFSTKAKQQGIYVCSSCGNESSKWSGTCWYCKAYNTLAEFKPGSSRPLKSVSGKNWVAQDGAYAKLTPIASVTDAAKDRLKFGSEELDRLFGGGLVKGSVNLLAGPPGVGKSTLSLQMACLLAGAQDSTGQPYSRIFSCDGSPLLDRPPPSSPSLQPVVVYVCGEESAEQVKGRAMRLGLGETPGLWLLSSTDVEQVMYQVEQSGSLLPPGSAVTALVLDSVQTMSVSSSSHHGGGELGPQGQLREVGRRVVEWAHRVNIPVLLIGHVTKSGDVAGPRVLEHMVDAVMMIEGEQEGGVHSLGGAEGGAQAAGPASTHSHRIVRASKNRHGSTSEVGLFSMGERGFHEAVPSALFLSSSSSSSSGGEQGSPEEKEDRDGCVVTATIEGTRALCIEVQALATPCLGAYPRHRAMGVPSDRMHLAWAVLSKHTHMKLAYVDLLVNVVGGLRVTDPATDLALAVAIASSRCKVAAPRGAIFLGELGLGGEVRPPARLQERLRAAAKLGFQHAYVGAAGAVGGSSAHHHPHPASPLPVTRVRHIREALSLALGTIGTPSTNRRRSGGGLAGEDADGDGRKRPSPPSMSSPQRPPLVQEVWPEGDTLSLPSPPPALPGSLPAPPPPEGHPDWAYGGMDSNEDPVEEEEEEK